MVLRRISEQRGLDGHLMDDIAKEARERLDESHHADRDNRIAALEDMRHVAGFQWTDAARAERAGRPIVTINRSSQFLRQVSNPIRQNMPTIKVEPDRDDDSDMAEIANGLLRRIQYNSSAGHVYAQSVEHMVSCGIGWFRIDHKYLDNESFNQEIIIKRVFDPLSIYPDPSSREPDRSDMGFCLVTEMIPRETFKQRYKKARDESFPAPSDMGSTNGIPWTSGDNVRIAEYWKRKSHKKTLALLHDDRVIDITDMDEARVRAMVADGFIVNTRDVDGFKPTMTLVSGEEQIADTYECPSQWIPIVPVVGSEIPLANGVYRHGLIRFQREPQQLHNYAMSVLMESFGLQPKAPILGTEKQIGPYKALWDKSNRSPTPYLLYGHDERAAGPPQRLDPAPLNQSAVAIAQMMSDDMKATTGIYDAALGAKSNETSGVAIAQREEQGNQATFHFVDNLEHSLEHAGRIILEMIPKIYDTHRTLKIIGDDDTEKAVEVNKPMIRFGNMDLKHNDLSQMKFQSVRVVLGPSYASRRAETVQNLINLVQALPQVGQVGADFIVKNMDFEGNEQMAERLRSLLPPQVLQAENPEQAQAMQPPPDPMAEAQAQGALRMMEAQGVEAEAKASEAQARAASAAQNVHVEAEQAVENLIGTRLENDLKRKKLSEPPPQARQPAGSDARQ